jgi:hypothetical protein
MPVIGSDLNKPLETIETAMREIILQRNAAQSQALAAADKIVELNKQLAGYGRAYKILQDESNKE